VLHKRKSITSTSSSRIHAFPTIILGRRDCRRPAILCEVISWTKLATSASTSFVSRSPQLRECLKCAQPPTCLLHPNSHLLPSIPSFYPYASTFAILQDHCHRPSCLQSSKAPGITTISINTIILRPLAQVNSPPKQQLDPEENQPFLSVFRTIFASQ
jgi:hypothetical protein